MRSLSKHILLLCAIFISTPSVAQCDNYTYMVGGGYWDEEITWNFTDDLGNNLASGAAPSSGSFCLAVGCYTLNMYDSFGDGWNEGTFVIFDSGGNAVGGVTLNNGSFGTQILEIGGADCGIPDPVTASDCSVAVDVCDDLNFAIDPNGNGMVDEIPPPGSTSNPEYYGDSPWNGGNSGCLLSGELNSTWMIVNIAVGGSLEFTFGGLGSQAGYYDWAMWPYDAQACGAIANDLLPPVRCNWNGSASGGTGLASTIPAGGFQSNFEPPLDVLAMEQYLICFSNYSSVSTTVPLEFGGTAEVSCEPVFLSVEWGTIQAVCTEKEAVLSWQTVSEKDNDFFLIERSQDSQIWDWAGEVSGNGYSQTELNYEFIERGFFKEVNYYRIVQVDFNGNKTISPTESVYCFPAESLILYPNPVSEAITISGLSGAGAIIFIRDQQGRMVLERGVAEQILQTNIDAKGLHSGIYFLEVLQHEAVAVLQFSKR